MKDNTLDVVLIAIIIAIVVLWVLLGLGLAETGTMIFSVETEIWNKTPDNIKALFIKEVANIYVSKYPNCAVVAIEKFNDEIEIHFRVTCSRGKELPGVEI